MPVFCIVLTVIAALCMLIILLLCTPLRIRLRYQDELHISIHILCFPVRSFFASKKLIDIKPESKKKKKKPRESAPKPTKKDERGTMEKISTTLSTVLRILRTLRNKARGRIHAHVRRLQITVGTNDVAGTAILYGTISQLVSYIFGFLESFFILHSPEKAHVSVSPDFVGGKTSADVDISLSITLRQALAILLSPQ